MTLTYNYKMTKNGQSSKQSDTQHCGWPEPPELVAARRRCGQDDRLRNSPDFWIGVWFGVIVAFVPAGGLFFWIFAR